MAEAASSNVQSRRRALVLATAFGALAGVALWQRLDLGFRGPSLDETSGLYVARLLRQGVAWSTYAYATSSQIPMHLFGVGEQLGGLWGARVLSALLSACSLGFFFGGMRALFGSTRVAAWAVMLLALQAPHLFTGKLATSEVVALCFFTGSMWLLIEGLGRRHFGWLYCALASVAFTASVLSHYLVLAHAPILLVLVAVRRPRLMLVALAPCTLLLADYLHRHWMELQVLAHQQLALLASTADSRLAVLHDTATYVAPMLALALASLAMQVWRAGAGWRAIRLHVFLLSLAVPLIGLHVAFATRDQLPLHLVYPLVALTPLAAWFLHRLSRRSLALSLGAAAVLAVLGLAQTRQLERSFPELTPVVEHLRTHLGPTTTVLSEEGYLLRFAFPELPARNFSELSWLDNDGDGRRTAQDVIDAVWDGKPDYVLTTGQIAPTLVEKLRTSVLPHRYRKVLEQPYALSDALTRHPRGAVELWKRSGARPAAR